MFIRPGKTSQTSAEAVSDEGTHLKAHPPALTRHCSQSLTTTCVFSGLNMDSVQVFDTELTNETTQAGRLSELSQTKYMQLAKLERMVAKLKERVVFKSQWL